MPLRKKAGAAHAGIKLYVALNGNVCGLCGLVQLKGVALVHKGLGDVVIGKHLCVFVGSIAQYEYGLCYAALTELQRFAQAGHRECVRAALFKIAPAAHSAVTVSIGLYNTHYLFARGARDFIIVLQRGHVYFRPCAGGGGKQFVHFTPPKNWAYALDLYSLFHCPARVNRWNRYCSRFVNA